MSNNHNGVIKRIDSGVITRVRELAKQDNRNLSNWIETRLKEAIEKRGK